MPFKEAQKQVMRERKLVVTNTIGGPMREVSVLLLIRMININTRVIVRKSGCIIIIIIIIASNFLNTVIISDIKYCHIKFSVWWSLN